MGTKNKFLLIIGIVVVSMVVCVSIYLLKQNKKVLINSTTSPQQSVAPSLNSTLQSKLDELTKKEFSFGTAKISLKIYSEDTSITHVTVNDSAKNLNVTYKIPGIEFGLLYMMRYQDGDLYITTRTDCPIKIYFDQYADNDCGENWDQQIMVYSSENKQGRILRSGRDLGLYAVSDDKKYIAVAVSVFSSETGDILILDNQGNVVKRYTNKDVGFYQWVEPNLWKDHVLYVLSSGVGEGYDKVATIDVDTDKITTFSIPGVSLSSEFVFSPDLEKIAYTDFPWFGGEANDSWTNNNNTNLVNLFVFSLDTKTKTKIATSHARKFNVNWIDSKTLQYNDPITEELVTKILE